MLEFDQTWIEQQQRVESAYAARSEEANLNTDLCTEGRFDGIIGLDPRFPEIIPYWQGYVDGLRHFWLSQQQKTIQPEF